MIDSAQAYNEEHVGFALEKSGIPREDIFIVSKVHPRFLGYQETLQSVEESLKNLKVKFFINLVLHNGTCIGAIVITALNGGGSGLGQKQLMGVGMITCHFVLISC